MSIREVFRVVGSALSYLKIQIIFKHMFKIRTYMYTGFIGVQFRSIGRRVRIEPFVKLVGAKYISIGNEVSIHDSVLLSAWDRFNGVDYAPEIVIGDGSSIGGECHISAINGIYIGKDVLLGRKITLTDNSHGEFTSYDLSLKPNYRILYSRGPIIIEDGVWIGDKVTVLPGVTIGMNSIVGANSVVTKDIPPNTMVAGVPSRVIKTLQVD